MRGKIYSKILVNRPEKQILLTAIHKNIEIDSYQCGDSVTFQVIEGMLKLKTRKESVIINEGQLFSLHDNTKYSLSTDAKTMFLLTIEDTTQLREIT